ncbi:hypothetical protein KIN20_029277 [Parelaphostrongylus tenuis]|uniref:Uncharacterized protein n=1 Tax=Parelaphostrongylus tenuis TaxID=148309 RepID=A0AAD5WFH3_PARTN|nr:hypothetical protein KIN20_029277 [Parelaphostrongylus tenuis]
MDGRPAGTSSSTSRLRSPLSNDYAQIKQSDMGESIAGVNRDNVGDTVVGYTRTVSGRYYFAEDGLDPGWYYGNEINQFDKESARINNNYNINYDFGAVMDFGATALANFFIISSQNSGIEIKVLIQLFKKP